MRRTKQRDCFEVCDNYGECFDMSCQTGDPQEWSLLENIMDEADAYALEGRCMGECTILRLAKLAVERHRHSGGDFSMPALKHYRERFEKDQLAGQQ